MNAILCYTIISHSLFPIPSEAVHHAGRCAVRPASDGCCGRGISVVGAIDRGWASTTYWTPSSDMYDGGRGL